MTPESKTRDARIFLRRLLILPTLTAVGFGLFVLVFGLVSNSKNFDEHAVGHWFQAIPVIFVDLVIVGLPEASTRPRRIGRLFLTVVISALAVALVLEGIGAFADGGIAEGNPLLENAHRLGEGMTLFAILSTPIAVAGLSIVYVLASIRWIVKHASS